MGDNGWPALWPKIDNRSTESEALIGSSPISLITVAGDYNLGKTKFGWSIIVEPVGSTPPISVWDGENSGGDYATSRAADWHDLRGIAPLDAWQMFEAWVKSLEPERYAVCLLDTNEPIEEGVKDYVFTNPRLFGKTPGQYSNGKTDRTGLYWGDVKMHLRHVLNELGSKVQTIVVTRHLRQFYAGSSPVNGKYEPKGLETWDQLATVSAWLVPGESGIPGIGAPSAVITKCRMDIDDWGARDEYGNPVTRPILPRFMVEFSPRSIREFMTNPRPFSEKEMSKLDPSALGLNEDQRLMMRQNIANAEAEAARQAEEEKVNNGKRQLAADLKATGLFSQDNNEFRSQISAGMEATKHTYNLSGHEGIFRDLVEWKHKLDSAEANGVKSPVVAE